MNIRAERYSILTDLGEAPPGEFRLFKKGWNETRKGRVLFDDVAAKSVLDAFAVHGVDMMIDLEHLSLDDEHPNYDPDARGWHTLELRNGELWAVSVKWTPDGNDRLTNKKQRYISPAFVLDKATKRVVELVNIALCAMPATDKIQPLIAAANRGGTMDKEAICKLLGLPAEASDEECMKALADALTSGAEAMKKLAAMPADKGDAVPSSENSAALTRLSLKVKAIEESSATRDLVAANRAKLNGPAQERWALKQSPDALKEFFANAPDLPEHVRLTEKNKGADKVVEAVTLTDEEKEICRLTGQDEKTLLAHKVELLAQKGKASR